MPRSTAALVVSALAAGCGGGDVEVVPTDLPRVTATPTCVPVAAGSRVLGTSSEGELWLADGATGTATVVDALGAVRTGLARVDDAAELVPWSREHAAV